MDKNSEKIAREIEAGYDLIADKFSETRSHFWKDLDWIGDEVKKDDRVLDFGCGNGRLLEILKDKKIDYWGVDVSEKLLAKAREKYPNIREKFLKTSAQERLTFPPDYFNVIFAIAVFHHFPPDMQCEKAQELYHSLGADGKLIISVWNLTDKYKPESAVHIPFKNEKSNSFERYHWVFDEAGLVSLFPRVGFSSINCYLENQRNWIVIAQK
jgi:alkylated DNA repair protein alkB homolog 8